MNLRQALILFLLFGFLSVSCSSVEKREKENNRHLLHKVSIENLRVRRPAGEGANPDVNPGGMDYQSHPLPDAQFDCTAPESLYSGVALEKLRECIRSVPDQKSVVYRLRRLPVPVLELQEGEEAEPVPACLRELLPRIPVPREIFFQNDERGQLNCFSSRIAIEADDIPGLGVKWPLSKTHVRVEFPPAVFPDTDRKTVLLLLSWSLSPYFSEPEDAILSHLVPDSICSKCLGEKKMYKSDGRPILFWP